MPDQAVFSFGADRRLHVSREYSRVWREGQRVNTHNLTVIAANPAAPGQERSRLGITVSRKVGNAVCRNRLKRWTREFFRTGNGRLVRVLDLVVIAKPGLAGLDRGKFDLELGEAFRRLRLYADA